MAERLGILVLNHISASGLSRLPAETYSVGKDVADPVAILVRSADLHKAAIAPSVQAIARAGAGTNNIPVAQMSARGVPVFNAPGANANAVKELVLAGMLMAARRIAPALRFVDALDGKASDLDSQVEDGKKAYAGYELAGQTLGIVGLGKVGALVADAAISMPARTSSLTALALAPGALNTGTPRALIASTGMLLVPAPARPIARTLAGIAIACRSAERTRIATGSATSLPTV